MSQRLISLAALLILLIAGAVLTPLAAAESVTDGGGETAVFYQDDDTADTGAGENGGTTDIFDSVGAIFAVLGIYVVTMFTMAIGTEILVDIFKGILGKPLGLKNKPKTRQTLAEYETFLQGSLADLGLSAEAKHRLEQQVADLKKLLEPAFTAEEVVVHLRREEFSEALAQVGLDGSGQLIIDEAKAATKQQIHSAIAQIDTRTSFGQAIKVALERNELEKKADKAIDRLARRAANVTPEEIYHAVNELVNGEIADGITAWTRAYLNSMKTESYEAANALYEYRLKPQVKAFGLGEKLEDEIESQFETFLQHLKTYRGTDTFLESLNDILVELELQRNQARSMIGRAIDAVVDSFKKLLRHSPLQAQWLVPIKYDPRIKDSSEAATKMIDLEQFDKEQDNKRVRRLRFTAVILGTLLAYLLQIDSADLLQDLFPSDANFLYITLIPQGAAVFTWIERAFNIPTYDLTAGIILTGLAASAGSSFWHDQLSRLQAAKKSVEIAEETVRPLIQQAQQRRDDANRSSQ